MTSREKTPAKGRQHSLISYTFAILILVTLIPSGLVGCGPSTADLEAVDYAPLSGDDWQVSTPAKQGLDAMLVAVAGALADGETVIRDAGELRVKESDRIATMVTNLTAVGVDVVETDDGMRVTGGPVAGGAEVESFGDHRIAMAMAVLGLHAQQPVQINDVACVATSYPEFWEDMERITYDA